MSQEELTPDESMEILTEDFNFEYTRYRKKFLWEAFQKFNIVKQQLLCERYNIILIGHQTKGERIKRILKGFNATNISKAANEISKTANELSKAIADMNKGLTQSLASEPTRRSKNRKKKETIQEKAFRELFGK